MTDATNPGDIQVWGQRRQANGLFPSAGGAGVQPPLGTPAKEKRDPESPYYDPCALPIARRAWNADAAAIAQINPMMAAANAASPGGNFSNHEVIVTLYRGSDNWVNGTTPIAGPWFDPNCIPTPGNPCVAGVSPGSWSFVNTGNWMRDIHSHPWNRYWGVVDRNNFRSKIDSILSVNPNRAGDVAWIASYVTVVDPNSPTGYGTYAHTYDTPEGQVGREVNPLALPCPNP